MNLESIRDMYSDEGTAEAWQESQRKVLPYDHKKFTETLTSAGLLPTGEDLEGFVLFSPSANQGRMENAFATQLNTLAEGRVFKQKPKVIAGDMFGTEIEYGNGEGKYFKPGFNNRLDWQKNVDTHNISSQAQQIPLPDKSVNLLWDRAGALWHSIQQTRVEYEDKVTPLLEEYKRVLKEGGSVVIDASEEPIPGVGVSTHKLMETIFEKAGGYDYFGWEVHVVGEGYNKIAILKPNVQVEQTQ